MKLRRTEYTILIISLSIIIVGIIQAYIIREQYRLKSNYFDLQYSQVINSGLSSYRSLSFSNPLDSAFMAFDDFASRAVPVINYMPGDSLSDSARISILNVFRNSLYTYDRTGGIIRESLKKEGLDTSFILHYEIRELSLIDFNHIIPVLETQQKTKASSSEKPVISNSLFNESNYFLAALNLKIDFPGKRNIIYREMKGILLIVFITLVIILLAFGYSLRALNRQKKLSDLKSDFIDNISHEFKTPLSSISLAASTLKHPVVGSDLVKRIGLCNNILNQNRILNEMIDQVIDAGLIESGRMNLRLSPVNLKEYMEGIIADFQEECKPGNVRINFLNNLPDSFTCQLDKNQIYRVMKNIMGNSVKYCETDPEINVSIKKYDDLVIEISDNGPGISKEEQALIFNRFYRARRNAGGKTKGMGLGLYIVKKIVQAHGGLVSLESENGMGTRVSILIPV